MTRNSFNWSGDVYVDIDINYDDALGAIPEEYIRDWLGDFVNPAPKTVDLEDPVKRLEVIVALRALGYSVESA